MQYSTCSWSAGLWTPRLLLDSIVLFDSRAVRAVRRNVNVLHVCAWQLNRESDVRRYLVKPTRRRSHASMREQDAWACTRCVWRDIHLVTLQKYRTAGLMYIIMKRRNLITSVCKQCCYHSATVHGERDFLLIIEFSLCETDVTAIDYPLCSCWFFILDSR